DGVLERRRVVGGREPRRARGLDGEQRLASDADELVGARRDDRAPGLAVGVVRDRAELEHVAEDHDEPAAGPGPARRRGLERGAQRDRVRVVRVVQDPHVAGDAPDAPARDGPCGREAVRDLVEREPEGRADGRGGKRVRHVVAPREAQRDVTAPIVGRASSARYAISPGRLVPSSSTSAWCSGASRRSVSGRPHWLLKLPAGLSTLKRVASTAATSSLVVVLPLDPVTATTGT